MRTHKTILPRNGRKALLAAGLVALMGASALTGPALHDAFAKEPQTSAPITLNRAPAQGFADIVETVMPAVVSVKVESKPKVLSSFDGDGNGQGLPFPKDSPFWKFFKQFPGMPGGDGPQGRHAPHRTGLGSGFIISEDGYIVTNNHVVQDAETVTVATSDGTEYDATVVGTDPKTDLAVLKVEADKALPHVAFATDGARVGDWVIAVGNPFGLGGTVTTGIVSARGREIGAGPYDDFLQIDAPINRGNSGGPAFNLKGEVVGVNTAIYSPSGGSVGIGFAIPASMANDVVGDLIANGGVTRGWLGVQIQPVTGDIAESLDLAKPEGAIVLEVTEDSPAAKAGLKTGDTVLSVNGHGVKDPRDLARQIAAIEPGETAKVEVLRDGDRQTLDVTIGTMPGAKQQAARAMEGSDETSLADLGLRVAPSEDGEGVSIVGLDPDGPAAGKGIRPGDQIVEVAGAAVKTPEELNAALEKAGEGDRKSVLVLVRTSDGQRFVALPLKQG